MFRARSLVRLILGLLTSKHLLSAAGKMESAGVLPRFIISERS